MDFIVKDSEGNESAPLPRKEVEQWLLTGKINGETMIRTTMLNKWNPISKVGVLADALAYAEQKLALENPEEADKIKQERFGKEESEKEAAYGSSFRNRVEPVPAGLILRVCSSLTDFLVVALVAAIIAGAGWIETYFYAMNDTRFVAPPEDAPAKVKDKVAAVDTAKVEPTAETDTAKAEKRFVFEPGIDNENATETPTNLDNLSQQYNLGSRWIMEGSKETYCCVYANKEKARWVKAEKIHNVILRGYSLLILAVLLYFGIGLGVYAQTVGMWFWGIFICRTDNNEAYLFRSFVFTILLLLLGWTMPLLVVMRGIAIHDRLAGVKLVRTSGERGY